VSRLVRGSPPSKAQVYLPGHRRSLRLETASERLLPLTLSVGGEDRQGHAMPEGLMRPFQVIEGKVAAQGGRRHGNAFVVLEVNLLVVERAPQARDEDVVEDPAPPVHADRSGHSCGRASQIALTGQK